MTTIADITFTEPFDGDNLAYLVKHADERTLDANAKAKAIAYLSASRDGCVDVRYRQAEPGGRWYADRGLSLQSMKRAVRHTIGADKYQDIDMVNAQPTMIQHLCRKHELVCPRLDEYVTHRDALLEALGCKSRDEAKAMYLTVMNGGSCDKAKQTPHLKAFKQEMCAIAQSLKATFASEFKKVKQRRVAKGKLTNHAGAFVSILYQQLENQVLECMFEFFGRCRNCVLCFDGIMTPSDMDCNLDACQQHVFDKLKIGVTLKLKPFDQALPLPADLAGTYDAVMLDLTLARKAVTNESVGEQFLRRFKSDVICNELLVVRDQLCHWQPKDGTWQCGSQRFNAWVGANLSGTIQLECCEEFKTWEAQLGRWMSHLSDSKREEAESNIASAKKQLIKFKHTDFLNTTRTWIVMKLTADAEIRQKIHFNVQPATRHFFQFRNGAYDLKAGTFGPRTKQMFVTEYLPYDYCDSPDAHKVSKLRKLFKQVLPQPAIRKGFLRWRGYCLTGETKAQCFVFNVGFTAGNGKSTMFQLFRDAFPMYCRTLNNKTFNQDSREYQKALSALLNLPCRLVVIEEMGKDNLDAERLKAVADGTTLALQPLYREEVNMPVQFKIEANSNHNPAVAVLDQGINRRGRVFKFDSQFVESGRVDEANHKYLLDSTLASLINLDTKDGIGYAQALFSICAPYARLFYTDGLVLPKECKLAFQAAVSENDYYESFFADCVSVATTNVWIGDAESVAAAHARSLGDACEELNRKDLIKEFRKRGFTYDSQREQTVGKQRHKGFVLNCSVSRGEVDGSDRKRMRHNDDHAGQGTSDGSLGGSLVGGDSSTNVNHATPDDDEFSDVDVDWPEEGDE